MSRGRNLLQRVRQLGEIQGIMSSMKNLAFLEVRKLARGLENQQRHVADIEAVAADFLSHYPYSLPGDGGGGELWILFGSERGFCGDFNARLLQQLAASVRETDSPPRLIPVGHKLCAKLQGDPRVLASIDGPNVAEEITPVLSHILQRISQWQSGHPVVSVFALYHHTESAGAVSRQLLPPFQQHTGSPAAYSWPPVLNLRPRALLMDIADHYLFTALHEIAYTAFLAENQARIHHMEAAIRHLDDNSQALMHRYRALRQEEITEELEVILLNAEEITNAG